MTHILALGSDDDGKSVTNARIYCSGFCIDEVLGTQHFCISITEGQKPALTFYKAADIFI